MPRGTVVHRFGPFELDLASGRLFCGDRRIPLSDTQSAVLVHLVSHAGAVVAKDILTHTAWGGAAIADSSIEKLLSRLRKALGDEGPSGRRYIETVPHRGYRFAAAVERAERHNGDAPVDEQLAPFRAFVQGRTQLDTLDREAIRRARAAFEDALRLAPDYAPGHLGLSMACGLTFEATAATPHPDRAALQLGITHARRGCVLTPASGEAWSTLAFVHALCLVFGFSFLSVRWLSRAYGAVEGGDWTAVVFVPMAVAASLPPLVTVGAAVVLLLLLPACSFLLWPFGIRPTTAAALLTVSVVDAPTPRWSVRHVDGESRPGWKHSTHRNAAALDVVAAYFREELTAVGNAELTLVS